MVGPIISHCLDYKLLHTSSPTLKGRNKKKTDHRLIDGESRESVNQVNDGTITKSDGLQSL